MKQILDFLDQLMRNNNREWFQAHKEEYKRAQAHFNQFAEKLIAETGKFDPSVRDLTVADCTYRIYKDMRFSKFKIPYKTHIGAYVCPHGKKSGYAGYYFHLEPSESEDYSFGNMLAAGLYNPTPSLAIAIRDRIYNEPDTFAAAATEAEKHYHWDDNARLKKVPNGYPQDARHAEYLKLKTFTIAAPLPDDIVLGSEERLLDYVVSVFREAKPVNDFINQVVEGGCW
ncbi:MAG: DUF2461 domain-containing protein [Bacteroidales bacterium]|nr:DUF2461 domain-containing protein [Bacteroidales bacterium]